MHLSHPHSAGVARAPVNHRRHTVRIGAAEGLVFLAMSAVAIAVLIAPFTPVQRQIDHDFHAAAVDLSSSVRDVASLAVTGDAASRMSPPSEDNPVAPGTILSSVPRGGHG